MQRMWFSKFKERYLLDATFRYDGSSRFPKDKRYAFFPSVAIGWRISEEAFMKDNFEWINNLKLKASYGKLGNQEIGNYPYQSAYNLGYNYSFGGSMSQGVAITTAVDPTLHWELGLADVEQNNGLIGNGTYFVGYPMNIYYGYVTDGVFLDKSDIDSWYDQSSVAKNPKVGDIRYVDLDGDGKVTSKDRKVLGSRIPSMYRQRLGPSWSEQQLWPDYFRHPECLTHRSYRQLLELFLQEDCTLQQVPGGMGEIPG